MTSLDNRLSVYAIAMNHLERPTPNIRKQIRLFRNCITTKTTIKPEYSVVIIIIMQFVACCSIVQFCSLHVRLCHISHNYTMCWTFMICDHHYNLATKISPTLHYLSLATKTCFLHCRFLRRSGH